MFDMTFVERLIAVGYPPECADRIAANYIAQGDVDGLESFVISLECGHEIPALQPEPN